MKLLTMILLLFCLVGCGGGGGTSSTTGQSPSTPQSPKFKATTILSGKGQITQLAVSGSNIFWADGYTGKGIWKCVRESDVIQLLVPKLINPQSILTRNGYFYWIDNNKLYRTSNDGSATALMSTNGANSLTKIVADDDAVYWQTFILSSTSSSIERVPLNGSTPVKLYTTANTLKALTTDGTYIYWLETVPATYSDQLKLCRISKTGGAVETIYQGISSFFDPLHSVPIYYVDNYIYIGTTSNIIKIPSAGGSASVLATGVEAYGIAVAQGMIYWINYNRDVDTHSILSIPSNGGSVTTVAANVKSPLNLLASSSGLYWSESDPAFSSGYDMYRLLKRFSWDTGAVDVVTSGIYLSSFDISDNYIYCAENDYYYSKYAEISRIPLAGGSPVPLVGGINNNSLILSTTSAYLLIGDVTSLKKVPIEGGVTNTLFKNGRFEIADIEEQNGIVFFTSRGVRSGVYKVSLEGSSCIALSEETGLYGKIVSVQEGYVYYLLGQSNGRGGANEELRRVPISGGVSESVFKLPDGSDLVAFDGVGTVYWNEWIWNDQYKLIKYDIATGKSLQLSSGSYIFKGFNSTSIFIADYYGNIRQIPKNGGYSSNVLNIPYPLTIDPFWVKSGENFYFSISYLDDTQGYFSEIDFLEQLD